MTTTTKQQPAAEQQPSGKLWNVPNQLTALRLLLAVVMFVLLSLEPKRYLAALVVFAVAASTDWIDGYWARRFNQVTKLGRIFDPFVDKIIICGAFIFLAAEPSSGIAAWMAVVVVGREMLVTALRGFIEQSGGDFSARWAGKWKMVFQCAAVIASLLTLWYLQAQAAPPQWLPTVLIATVWLAVISTVYSGAEYIVASIRFLRQ